MKRQCIGRLVSAASPPPPTRLTLHGPFARRSPSSTRAAVSIRGRKFLRQVQISGLPLRIEIPSVKLPVTFRSHTQSTLEAR